MKCKGTAGAALCSRTEYCNAHIVLATFSGGCVTHRELLPAVCIV